MVGKLGIGGKLIMVSKFQVMGKLVSCGALAGHGGQVGKAMLGMVGKLRGMLGMVGKLGIEGKVDTVRKLGTEVKLDIIRKLGIGGKLDMVRKLGTEG